MMWKVRERNERERASEGDQIAEGTVSPDMTIHHVLTPCLIGPTEQKKGMVQ